MSNETVADSYENTIEQVPTQLQPPLQQQAQPEQQEFDLSFKNDLHLHIRELKMLNKEKNYLDKELKLCEQALIRENVCSKAVEQMLKNYSAKISNINNRCECIENAFYKLLKSYDSQFSDIRFQDSIIVKGLAQRLAQTIEMYELLNKKYKENEVKLDKYKKLIKQEHKQNEENVVSLHKKAIIESIEKEDNDKLKPKLSVNYLNTATIIIKVKNFLKNNNISTQLFAHNVLGISKKEFEKLISKNTPWICCKPKKRERFALIKQFLNDKTRITELLNYSLIANMSINNEETNEDTNIDDNDNYNDTNLNDYSTFNGDNTCDNQLLSCHYYENNNNNSSSNSVYNISIDSGIEQLHYLDTKHLSTSIYNYLRNNNIKQNLFAHRILGLSKSSFNKMILNPIKWSNLKPATKEKYYKIKKFLENESRYKHLLLTDTIVVNNNDASIIANDEINNGGGNSNNKTRNYSIASSTSSGNNDRVRMSPSSSMDILNDGDSMMVDESSISDLNLTELSQKIRQFLSDNKITQKQFSQKVLGLSKRVFRRILGNEVNVNGCKPQTKLNLIKLKNFINNEQQQKQLIYELKCGGSECGLNGDDDNTCDVDMMEDDEDLYDNTEATTMSSSIANDNDFYLIDLGDRMRRFLKSNNLDSGAVADKLFGISRRSFNHLLSTLSWDKCKLETKERLMKLKSFLDDKQQMDEMVRALVSNKKANNENGNDGEHSSKQDENNNGNGDLTILTDVADEGEKENKDEQDDDDDEYQENLIEKYKYDNNCNVKIDIHTISKRIYKFLEDNQISQSTFARRILGIEKAQFNRLIHKPKPWNTCKDTSKAYYHIMQSFLDDKEQVDKFLNKINKKRPIPIVPETPPQPPLTRQQSATKESKIETANTNQPIGSIIFIDEDTDMLIVSNPKTSTVNDSNDQELNTKDVSKNVIDYINKNKLNESSFGSKLLNLSEYTFHKLLYDPIEWNQCESSTKQYYKKLNNFINEQKKPK